MDIKELNKKQLILLTLLITFVVSIATGIVTVSLMQQMPKSVPQTINNVIQRTIEKVTTVPEPTPVKPTETPNNKTIFGDGDAMIAIYPADADFDKNIIPPITHDNVKSLGQGIIISDVGLILVDSFILTDKDVYRVTLDKTDFDATVLKKFSNGFAILKLSKQKDTEANPTQNGEVRGVTTESVAPSVDKVQ